MAKVELLNLQSIIILQIHLLPEQASVDICDSRNETANTVFPSLEIAIRFVASTERSTVKYTSCPQPAGEEKSRLEKQARNLKENVGFYGLRLFSVTKEIIHQMLAEFVGFNFSQATRIINEDLHKII